MKKKKCWKSPQLTHCKTAWLCVCVCVFYHTAYDVNNTHSRALGVIAISINPAMFYKNDPAM